MATITIPLNGKVFNGDQLTGEMNTAGASLSPPMTVTAVVQAGTDLEVVGNNLNAATCSAVLAAHVPIVPRVPRLIRDIYADLLLLAPAQQTNVKNDLTSGSPPKWQLSNRDAVWASIPAIIGTTGTIQARALATAVAFYCLDHPTYLVHPVFDASINVAGDQPVS